MTDLTDLNNYDNRVIEKALRIAAHELYKCGDCRCISSSSEILTEEDMLLHLLERALKEEV